MTEQAVVFGRDGSMMGVLSTPEVARSLPHVVILNAGFVHHVGPGRLAVDLARELAADGFPSLRFDFSGIGESAPRVPALDAIACGVADAKEAMDRLAESHGAQRFVLMGLCSGARHAHHIALADTRVVGAILLDGAAYPTPRSLALQLGSRLGHPLRLLASVQRRAQRWLGAKPLPQLAPNEGDAFFPADPSRERMAEDLRQLIAREVALLYVCSGEWRSYLYEGQLRAAFSELPLDGLLSERLFDSADHLYMTQPERSLLLRTIRSWLQERFAA